MAKKNALKPWRVKSWCISGKPSSTFVAKMEDVLTVYARPFDPKRPLVCLDETGKELQASKRGQLPLAPGQPIRQDYEYVRHGACNLFMVVAPLCGWRKVRVTDRHTRYDLAEQLRQLVEEDFPHAEKIILVTDNLSTHTWTCVYERFPAAQARAIVDKLEWHYTPEHGSWLNIAECELSVLGRQCLDQGFADSAAVEQAVTAWAQERNALQVTINWHFKTADARIKLKRLYPNLDV